MKKVIHAVLEQNAIYDGKPDFIDVGLLIYTLNHRAFGGTEEEFELAKGQLDDPKMYKTRVIIEYEGIEDGEG